MTDSGEATHFDAAPSASDTTSETLEIERCSGTSTATAAVAGDAKQHSPGQMDAHVATSDNQDVEPTA